MLGPWGTPSVTLLCNAGVGYTVFFNWEIYDNNGNPLPGGSSLDVNEAWTSGRQDDWAGNNWDAPPQVTPGTTATAANQQAATFGDAVQGTGNAQSGANPAPVCPGGSTTPVVHWGQAWYVGSATIGSGVLVQNDTIQKMVGTASEQ